jgi:hypothetical protein
MSKSTVLITAREFFEDMIVKAMETRGMQTFPMAQSYLTNLLEFYVSADNLFEAEEGSGKRKTETLAELYLRAQGAQPPLRQDLLKKLGDSSLYISGFFGDSFKRKIIDIDYYVEMGGAAYSSLAATVSEDTYAKVYNEFAERFVEFVDLLTFISQESLIQANQDVLRLYDRFLATGSELAREQLLDLGIAIPDQAKDH